MNLSVGLVTILEIIPIEDWYRTWPANRTIMLRLTSKRVNDAIDKIKPPTIISFNKSFWNNSDNDIAKKQELMIIYLSEISTNNIIVSLKICNIELFYDPQDHADTIGMCSPGIISLATAINIESTITNINLNDCNIGLRGIIQFSLIVNNYENLTHLNFSKNNIGPDGIKILTEALKNCLLLYHIDLSWNHIGHDGANSLANLIPLLKIKHLNLTSNQICNLDLKHLLDSCNQLNDIGIEELCSNALNDIGIEKLATVLGECTSLVYLNLSGNSIGDTGANKLSLTLSNSITLMHLDLSYNFITLNGAKNLASMLMLMQYPVSKKHLDLRFNKFNKFNNKRKEFLNKIQLANKLNILF